MIEPDQFDKKLAGGGSGPRFVGRRGYQLTAFE